MAMDYYKVLKLSRDATQEDMKKSFKRLAMKWHPDKNPANKQEAEAKFKQIIEAYNLLTDPHKRQIYDLYGEEGLRNFDASGVVGTRPDYDVFADFFDDVLRWVGNGEEGCKNQGKRKKPKQQAIVRDLVCSLEELYRGNRMKLMISRIVTDDFGKPKTVEEKLKINILPGWKKGTKVTFPGKGNEEPGFTAGDLVFVVDEKPHPVFQRDGNDLVINRKVSLLEALTGKTFEVTTLDGGVLTIPVRNIIKPGYEMQVPDEGMPIAAEPGMKGKLRIKFDVTFPSRLTAEQKCDLRRVLGGTDS